VERGTLKTFWFLFGGFILFVAFFLLDLYFLRIFGESLRLLLGLWGLLFGLYCVYYQGYLEGLKEGFEKWGKNREE